MWTFTRSALAIFLAVVLGLTSQSMAVARGQTRMGEAVVICSGMGITTIEVDGTGRPVGPAHICPDMVLAIFAALDLPPLALMRPEGQAAVVTRAPGRHIASRGGMVARARAPPVAV